MVGDDTAGGGLESVDGADHFGTPSAHQAGEGDHFAAADLETDIAVGRLAGQSGNLEQDFLRGQGAGREDVSHLAADHEGDQFSRTQIGRGGGADQAAIAEDRDAVGQTEDFVHLMRRVDDRHATGLQAGDGPEEGGDLVVGEGGRRFVHQDDVGLTAERLGDLDDLRLRHRERAHLTGGIDFRFEFLQKFLGATQLVRAVDSSEASAGFGAQGDVLRHRQIGDRHQFLMDHRDAGDQGVVW